MNFMKTSDEDMACSLRAAGFQELAKEGKYFVFVNDPNIHHLTDKSKVVYTNILNV